MYVNLFQRNIVMETLIYAILTALAVGVILYLLLNSTSKSKNSNHKLPNTTHKLHINYIEPDIPEIDEDDGKPQQLTEPKAGEKDDLKLIKGIGKVVEGVLNDNGIYHFDQILNWTDANIEWMNSHVIFFPKKIEREDWRGQAKELSKGKSVN